MWPVVVHCCAGVITSRECGVFFFRFMLWLSILECFSFTTIATLYATNVIINSCPLIFTLVMCVCVYVALASACWSWPVNWSCRHEGQTGIFSDKESYLKNLFEVY